MTYEETPIKSTKTQKETKKMEKPAIVKKGKMPVKEPASIKLSTIWKALVYIFAVIGVVLSIIYVNEIVNNVVDSRADAKAQQILKAQPAAAAPLKSNQ